MLPPASHIRDPGQEAAGGGKILQKSEEEMRLFLTLPPWLGGVGDFQT